MTREEKQARIEELKHEIDVAESVFEDTKFELENEMYELEEELLEESE